MGGGIRVKFRVGVGGGVSVRLGLGWGVGLGLGSRLGLGAMLGLGSGCINVPNLVQSRKGLISHSWEIVSNQGAIP